MTTTPKLQRALSLPILILYGVGVIVGAGIYSVIGVVAGVAGEHTWLSFCISGMIALLTAFSYAELITAFPHAGAEYVYVRKALPRWPSLSFVAGMLIAITGATTAATVAIAFGNYFQIFFDWPNIWMALSLLLLCTFVNIWGIRESSWVIVGCTLLEVGGLAIIIALGLPKIDIPQLSITPLNFGVVTGAALSFFIYTGFEGLANLAEEAKDPKKDLPKALFFSLAITAVLYILVALSAFALSSAEELAQSDSPLATALQKISPEFSFALAGIALFSTANTALISLLVGSRLLYGISSGGDLPKFLARVLPGRKTPWLASVIIFFGAAALLPLGKIEIIASLSSVITLLVFILVHGAVIVLRFRAPQLERPFRIPMAWRRLPILPVLAIFFNLALMTQFKGIVYLVAGGFCVFTFLAYKIFKK